MPKELTKENGEIRQEAEKNSSVLYDIFIWISTIGSTIAICKHSNTIIAELFSPIIDLTNISGFGSYVFKAVCLVIGFATAYVADSYLFTKQARAAFSEFFILCEVLFSKTYADICAARGIAHNIVSRFFAGFGVARLLQMMLCFLLAATGFTISFTTSYQGTEAAAAYIKPSDVAKDNSDKIASINARRDAAYKLAVGDLEKKVEDLRKEAAKPVLLGKEIEKMASRGNGWAMSKIDSAQKATAKIISPRLAEAEKQLNEKIKYFNDNIAPSYQKEINDANKEYMFITTISDGGGFMLMVLGVGALMFCLMMIVVKCLNIVSSLNYVMYKPEPIIVEEKNRNNREPKKPRQGEPSPN